MSIGEWLFLKRFLWLEQGSVIRRYYPKSPSFALADLLLGIFSFFSNPYRVCRKKGEVYGETPISTLEKIVEMADLRPTDCWLELGSGRGKSCFWVAQIIGCQTIGVEKIPSFVRWAKMIAFLLKLNVRFELNNLWDVDVTKVSCVYIYSTCFSDQELQRLSKKMKTLPQGARIVTISSPLPGWSFQSFPVLFPWGEAEAYLHINYCFS